MELNRLIFRKVTFCKETSGLIHFFAMVSIRQQLKVTPKPCLS